MVLMGTLNLKDIWSVFKMMWEFSKRMDRGEDPDEVRAEIEMEMQLGRRPKLKKALDKIEENK